jgi:hypothetical protein
MRLILLSVASFLFFHAPYLNAMDPHLSTFVCELGVFVKFNSRWHEVLTTPGAGQTVFSIEKHEKVEALYNTPNYDNFGHSISKKKNQTLVNEYLNKYSRCEPNNMFTPPSKVHLATSRNNTSLTAHAQSSELEDRRELDMLKLNFVNLDALVKFVEGLRKGLRYNRLVLTFLQKANNSNENAIKELIDAMGKNAYLKSFELNLDSVDLPLILQVNKAIKESLSLEEISLNGLGIGLAEICLCAQGLSELAFETQEPAKKVVIKLSTEEDISMTWLKEMKYPIGFHYEHKAIILSVVPIETTKSGNRRSKGSSKIKAVFVEKNKGK